MLNLVDGVAHELRPATYARNKPALDEFRERLKRKRITPSRKSFERELEAHIEGSPVLLAAARRHINKVAPPLIHAAEDMLRRANDILARANR